MSTKQHNKAQERWWKAGFNTIVNDIKLKYEAKTYKDLNDEEKLHLDWRLGLNLYRSHKYFDAIKLLEKVCYNGIEPKPKEEKNNKKKKNEEEEVDEEQPVHPNSDVHLTAARCCVHLFKQTKSHYHLEHAYRHYTNSIETLHIGLATMFKLPTILLEFGKMLEDYGALQPALDIYSRILTNFPNSRIYFDAMYRCTIVGRSVAERLSDLEEREGMINKCIDMLQFLLEAVPETINDIHIIILYARTLELSKNPSIRYRANGAYQSLYEYCRDREKPIANANKYTTFKEWMDDPKTWITLGDIINGHDEPILAKDGYELFTQKVEATVQPGKDLSSVMDVETCLRVAKNHASFQHYDEAVKYASIALKINRYDKETRHLLSQWSKVHATQLGKEKSIVDTIVSNWKERCWSTGYRRKIKNLIVSEMENRLESNRFDTEAREQLSYYARDKWRSRFLFEVYCASIIQKFIRKVKIKWDAEAPHRQIWLSRASEAYANYKKKKPRDFQWDKSVRADIRKVTDNRFCPKKHIIKKIRLVIDEQDEAVPVIERNYMKYRDRVNLYKCIERRKIAVAKWKFEASRKIQCMIRLFIARRVLKAKKARRKEMTMASIRVQRYVRWRNSTFQHAVTRICRKIRDRKAYIKATFVYTFLIYLKRYFKRKKERKMREERRQRLEAERLRREYEERRLKKAIITMKRFFRFIRDSSAMTIALKSLRARREREYSHFATQLLASVVVDKNARYQPPGVSQQSAQFTKVLNQDTILCPSSFTTIDCMMLSNILKNRFSNVHQLFLHQVRDEDNPSYEFDLLPSIGKCRALRSVCILGGKQTQNFIGGLLRQVQVENPSIKELCIENVLTGRASGEFIADSAGRLLCDYFNYTLPGIMTLSLHGCNIRDVDLGLLATGMSVNTSVSTLILSLNLITDEGFMIVFDAIAKNKKGILKTLDFGYNMIVCRRPMRELVNSFISNSTETLHVSLLHNRLFKPFTTEASHRKRLEVIVECDHDLNDGRLSISRMSSSLSRRMSNNNPLSRQSNKSNESRDRKSPKKMFNNRKTPSLRSLSAGDGLSRQIDIPPPKPYKTQTLIPEIDDR